MLLVRLHIINVQPICKLQLTRLCFKNIRYYRLTITHDKIHEVIQMSMSLVQYSNLITGVLMNTATNFAMSKHFRQSTDGFMTVFMHTYFQNMSDCGRFE